LRNIEGNDYQSSKLLKDKFTNSQNIKNQNQIKLSTDPSSTKHHLYNSSVAEVTSENDAQPYKQALKDSFYDESKEMMAPIAYED
jgi:hypothetical protein